MKELLDQLVNEVKAELKQEAHEKQEKESTIFDSHKHLQILVCEESASYRLGGTKGRGKQQKWQQIMPLLAEIVKKDIHHG